MKKKTILSAISAVLFVLLIIMLKTIDVKPLGPADTLIGLSALNTSFHSLTGVDYFLYKVTDILGTLALMVAALFALIGLIQFIKRRSIIKVDGEIKCLGILYIVTLFIYALFEKLIINYRPVILPGDTLPEASFPSSHTMLTLVIMVSTILIVGKYIKDSRLLLSARIICGVIAAVTVIGRLLCGVHWLTDIAGGILISLVLLFLFSAVLDKIKE